MNLLLRGGSLVSPQGLRRADLLIRGGKIALAAPSIEPASIPGDVRVMDCGGLFVFPGFIDAHTHFGLGEGEDRTADGFFEGSAAAAAGGVTTFIDFSDQLPGMTLLEGAEARIGEAAPSVIDFALHQGIYRFHPGMARELDDLAARGVRALKIFTTYRNFGVLLEPSSWDTLFPLCAAKRFLLTIHAEDDDIIAALEKELCGNQGIIPGGIPAGVPGPAFHPRLRPPEAEASAIMRTGLLALRYKLPLYFVHVSSALGMEAVRELRRLGLRVAAETTPHYLLLDESRLAGEDGALFLMTPPLRSPADRDALKTALVSGEIDILATDHCSYTPGRKKAAPDCRLIPAGIPGTGEAASLLFTLFPGDTEAKARALCALFSRNPAQMFGLYPEKGSLEPGTDGDVTLFDPTASGRITKSSIRTVAGYSPYEGFGYEGAPVATILRGEVIAERGTFTGRPGSGRFLACGESGIYR